MTRQMLQRLK